jgi:uncharacterized protein YlxW (UPF0749 family)
VIPPTTAEYSKSRSIATRKGSLEGTLPRRRDHLGRNISLLVAGLTLGLLLGLNWRQPALNLAAETAVPRGQVWHSVERLEAEQQELRATLADLRRELAERQQAAGASTERLQALQAELERQQLLAGLVAVEGPGILILLDDSHTEIPVSMDPNQYIVHEHDLRDIVNVLWMAGSEAMAINDERLVSHSSIYCVGSTVMVNDTRLSPPYTIRAIGNPRVQADYVRNPSYLQSLKEKQRLYGLRFEVRLMNSVTLPAYSGGFLVQHARPGR